MRKNGYITGNDNAQEQFEPWCAESEVCAENPVRFIKVFVQSLDLTDLGFVRSTPADTGRPGYAPQDLLGLYLYGHLNRIRSSRMLERECIRNIELWWLLGRLVPDHNTIADFRAQNREALTKAFDAFIHVCVGLKLVHGKSVCVDGTPIRANNSLKRATNMELFEKKLAYAREQLVLVEQYLQELDEADTRDQGRLNKPFALDIDPKHLPKPEDIRKRIAQHEQDIETMRTTGQKQLVFTDKDARVMKTKDGGRRVCYNVQAAADTQSHMLVAFDVTHDCNDMGKLRSTAAMAAEALETQSLGAIADKGYESSKDILDCLENGIVPDVGFCYDREQRVFSLEYVPAPITAEQRASQAPEDIRACLHAGVLPDCYADTNISLEVQEVQTLSCFVRQPDGTVTCPMGRTLFARHERKYGTVYESREACRTCPNRCTDSPNPKSVKFGPETRYVPVRMYGSPNRPLQQIPDVEQPNRYHAFDRVARQAARVMLFVKRDISKQKLRMQVSEHPFGTIKHSDNADHFLCRGFEKVRAETALMFLSYNIRRAISLAGGVQKLIAQWNGIAAPKCEKVT